jgi:hypothetical protein
MMRPLRLCAVLALLATGFEQPATAQAPSSYWCEPARAYFPQVATCPVPWRTGGPRPMSSGGVPAQPTPAPYRSAPYPTNYAPYDNYNHGNGP